MPYKDKQKAKEYQQQYRVKHADQLRARMKEYRQRPEVSARAKEYQREYIKENRDKHNADAREWTRTHPHYGVISNRNYRRKLRQDVIKHFGGKCVRCGFDDWRGLQIDHINGDGRKDILNSRQCPIKYHRALLKVEPGITYQLLCANCNQIKKYECQETTPLWESGKTKPSRMAQKLLEEIDK